MADKKCGKLSREDKHIQLVNEHDITQTSHDATQNKCLLAHVPNRISCSPNTSHISITRI